MNYRSLLTEAFDALRQLDEDVTEDFDKLIITPNRGSDDIWLDFDGLGVKGQAKVFIEGSEYGVPSFRQISKLYYRGVDECNFDRGWDVKPTDKQLFKNICKQLVDFRKENPYSVNESKKCKKNKTLSETLSYGEIITIQDAWYKFKEENGLKKSDFADPDLAWEFIEKISYVYPEEDEQQEIFKEISWLEEGGINESFNDKTLKESKEKHLIWSNEVDEDDIVEFAKDYYNDNYGDDYEISFEEWLSDNKDKVEEWLFDDNWKVYDDVTEEIDNQINHNTLFFVGNYNSNYPDFRPSGSGSITENSIDDLINDYDDIDIYSNNGKIEVVLKDHDGSINGSLFTLPTDNKSLLVIANNIKDYDDLSDEEKIDELIYDFEHQYRDFRDIANPELLVPIKDTF